MSSDFANSYKPSIAAILPVYNEALNVAEVLGVLHETRILDEIILVDDGSTDRSVEILREAAAGDPRMKILQHERNMGKGQAIFDGWAAASASIIVMVDADLKNLTPEHIQGLLAPIVERRADMTLGLFQGGHWNTDVSHWITPFLTGQRGLRAELLRYVSHEAARGYGFEVALSMAASQHGYRTRNVPLKGVWHTPSEYRSERGFWGGAAWKLHMYGQIIRAWYIASWQRYPKARAFFSDLGKY